MEKIYNFWQLIIQIKHNKWWRIMKLFQRARSNKKKKCSIKDEREDNESAFFWKISFIAFIFPNELYNSCRSITKSAINVFVNHSCFIQNYHVKIHKDLFTDAFKQEVFALRSKLWWQSFTGLIDWNCLVLSFFENIFCPSTRIMVPVVLYSSAV